VVGGRENHAGGGRPTLSERKSKRRLGLSTADSWKLSPVVKRLSTMLLEKATGELPPAKKSGKKFSRSTENLPRVLHNCREEKYRAGPLVVQGWGMGIPPQGKGGDIGGGGKVRDLFSRPRGDVVS